jgi:hypothetical protein
MRYGILWLTLAVLALGGRGVAQPPPDRPPGRPFGPPGGLERAVDDLRLPAGKRDTTLAAVRSYQDNVRRFTAVANSALLLKLKEVLSEEEYHKLGEALDKVRGPGDRRLTPDDVVARIMSFDKDKDGKVTKDELPERMQHLIELGDTNKDGALDRDEIKKLAADLVRDEAARGGGLGGGPPGGGRANAGDGLPPGAIERAVNDLNLSDKTKEAAAAALKAHQENVRTMRELARADLVLAVTDVLSGEEVKTVQTALDRFPDPPRPGPGPGGPGGRRPGPPPDRP